MAADARAYSSFPSRVILGRQSIEARRLSRLPLPALHSTSMSAHARHHLSSSIHEGQSNDRRRTQTPETFDQLSTSQCRLDTKQSSNPSILGDSLPLEYGMRGSFGLQTWLEEERQRVCGRHDRASLLVDVLEPSTPSSRSRQQQRRRNQSMPLSAAQLSFPISQSRFSMSPVKEPASAMSMRFSPKSRGNIPPRDRKISLSSLQRQRRGSNATCKKLQLGGSRSKSSFTSLKKIL